MWRLKEKPKYRNTKKTVDGIVFASVKEADRYLQLKLLEKGRKIADLQCQVPYELIPAQAKAGGLRKELGVTYFADFVYFDVDKDKYIIEDTKGVKTKEYVIKRKLMKLQGNEITEV